MASDYCNSVEMREALRRHEAGVAQVIPVLLRPVYWEDAPFSKLLALPTNNKPITLWSNQDQAFLDVAKGIRDAVQNLPIVSSLHETHKTKELNSHKGEIFYNLRSSQEALPTFDETIQRSPNFAEVHNDNGYVLHNLPTDYAFVYSDIGLKLEKLQKHEEALFAFEQAIQLNPQWVEAHNGRGNVLCRLGRHEEALSAFEQVVQLNPDFPEIYHKIEEVLYIIRFRNSMPNHFLIQTYDVIPENHLSIDWGNNTFICLNPRNYNTLQDLLEDIYVYYVNLHYNADTYGKDWVLVSEDCEIQYLAAPWEWLLKSKRSMLQHETPREWLLKSKRSMLQYDALPEWASCPPETYRLTPGTHWKVIRVPTFLFGIATDNSDLVERIFSLSRQDASRFMAEIDASSVIVMPETLQNRICKFVMVFTLGLKRYSDFSKLKGKIAIF